MGIWRRALTRRLRGLGGTAGTAAAFLSNTLSVGLGRIFCQCGMLGKSVAEPRFRTLLLSAFAALALILAAIGIYGVISFSVTQRTREIGVRKAIGARRVDIRLQFLLEAVVLTLVGGTIGILIGAGVSTLVRTFVPSIPASLSYLWVSIGFTISVGVGLFFGFYPANLAANLDPIVCLRYE